MITLTASWRIMPADRPHTSETMTVRSEADVDELVRRLGLPDADDAYVSDGPHMRAAMCVYRDWLYLNWSDGTFVGAPEGDPDSPMTHGTTEAEYAAGTGVSIDRGTRAVKEWLATGQRPTALTWVDDETLYERRFGYPPALSDEEQAEVDALLAKSNEPDDG